MLIELLGFTALLGEDARACVGGVSWPSDEWADEVLTFSITTVSYKM